MDRKIASRRRELVASIESLQAQLDRTKYIENYSQMIQSEKLLKSMIDKYQKELDEIDGKPTNG